MNITRELITPPTPRLERQWASRHHDTVVHANWNAAIEVDPINHDPKNLKLFGTTTYPNGAVERFTQE